MTDDTWYCVTWCDAKENEGNGHSLACVRMPPLDTVNVKWQNPNSSKSSNSTESQKADIQQVGEAVNALHMLTTEIVSLSTLLEKALSALLDAARAEGYSR